MGELLKGELLKLAQYPRESDRRDSNLVTTLGPLRKDEIVVSARSVPIAGRERLERELEIAREVQQHLFPQAIPDYGNKIDLAGHCRPALLVGGDYFDFIRITDKVIGIAIGDISGKGISAALLMASLQACLRSQAIIGITAVDVVVKNLNRLMCEISPSNRFATFFYAQYDNVSGDLAYVNAGHNAPLLFRNGTMVCLSTGGPVLGLLNSIDYTCERLSMMSGDLLVLFTDGVSERMNADNEEWGEQRMISTIQEKFDSKPADLLQEIMAAADVFAGKAFQNDDITLIIARFS